MIINHKISPFYFINQIKYDLIFLLIFGCLIQFLSNRYYTSIPLIPLSIPAFLGTAISILLSFKMSHSYDRWWEARKIWGAIVNDSRTYTLQLLSFVNKPELEVKELAYRQIAWVYACVYRLKPSSAIARISNLLPKGEYEEVVDKDHIPMAIQLNSSRKLADLHREGELDSYHHIEINRTLTRLTASMGGAERIKATVFPVVYRIILHLAIYLFAVVFTLSLKDVGIAFELPLLVILTSIFFLLEKSATNLQDPFNGHATDTALESISRNIEINIREMLGEIDLPYKIESKKYYIN